MSSCNRWYTLACGVQQLEGHDPQDGSGTQAVQGHQGPLPAQVCHSRPEQQVGGHLHQAAQEHVDVRVNTWTKRVMIFSVITTKTTTKTITTITATTKTTTTTSTIATTLHLLYLNIQLYCCYKHNNEDGFTYKIMHKQLTIDTNCIAYNKN